MDARGRWCVSSTWVSVSASFSPQIGERFASRYELKSPLRSDGAVRAFLAFDHHAGLDVALLLFEPASAHPTAWGAFARVVAAAAAGKIAGLLLPQGISSTPTVPPFCLSEPQALRGFDRLRDQGPMPWQRALTLGERAAEILYAAHAATGVAHRVLTPSRCAVTVRDDVRVLDFGVAELELGRLEEAGYRAPEQQQGGGDARSDVYTLGVMLFELISGQNLAGKPPPRLRSLVAVPRPVDEFMAKALSPDPAQRLDLFAMRAALRELLGVAAAPAEPTPAAASSTGSKPDISPVSIISAPPGARVAPSLTGPAPRNLGTPPRPSAPASATTTAPLPPKPEDIPHGVFPTIAARSGLLVIQEPPKYSGAGSRLQNLEDRTEKLEMPHRPSPSVPDRTEILAGVSPPRPPLVDRTEVLPAVPRPAPSKVDSKEVLPAVSHSKPVDPERTEVVNSYVAAVRGADRTSPRRSLAELALAQAKAGPAVTPIVTVGDDLPTEQFVKRLPPVDTTLLLPSEPVPARSAGEVRSPPPEPVRLGSVESQPAAEVRPNEAVRLGRIGVQPSVAARSPPSADPNATALVTPVLAPPSPKSKDPLKKALIWINVVCFSAILIAMLWLMIT